MFTEKQRAGLMHRHHQRSGLVWRFQLLQAESSFRFDVFPLTSHRGAHKLSVVITVFYSCFGPAFTKEIQCAIPLKQRNNTTLQMCPLEEQYVATEHAKMSAAVKIVS